MYRSSDIGAGVSAASYRSMAAWQAHQHISGEGVYHQRSWRHAPLLIG